MSVGEWVTGSNIFVVICTAGVVSAYLGLVGETSDVKQAGSLSRGGKCVSAGRWRGELRGAPALQWVRGITRGRKIDQGRKGNLRCLKIKSLRMSSGERMFSRYILWLLGYNDVP